MKLTHETLVRANPAQILLPRFTVSQIMRNDQQVSFRIFFTANHQTFDKNDYIVVKYAKVDSSGQPDHDADGNIAFYKPPNPPPVPPDNRDRLIFGGLKKETNGSYTIDWSQGQVSEVPPPQTLSRSSSNSFYEGQSQESILTVRELEMMRYRSINISSRIVSSITPAEMAEQQAFFSNLNRSYSSLSGVFPNYDYNRSGMLIDDPVLMDARQEIAIAVSSMSQSIPLMDSYEASDKTDSANSNKWIFSAVANPPDTPLTTKISSGQPATINTAIHMRSDTPATIYEATTDGQTVAVNSQGKPLHSSDQKEFTAEEVERYGAWLADTYQLSNSPSMFSDPSTGFVPGRPLTPPTSSSPSGPVIPTLPPDSPGQTPKPSDPSADDIEQTDPPPQRQGNSRFAKVFTMAREGEGNSSDDIDMGDEELRPQPEAPPADPPPENPPADPLPETPRPPNSGGPSSTDPPPSNSDQSSTTPPSSSTTDSSSSSTAPPSSSTTTPQPIQPIPQPAMPHAYTHLQPYVGHYSPGYDTVTGDLVWKVGFGFAGSFDTFEDYVSYLTRPILKRVQDELTSRPGGNGQRMQPDKGEVIDVIAMIAQKRLYFRSNPGYVYCYWGHATPRMMRLFQAPHYFRNHHCAHLYWYLVCATPHNTMLKDDTYRILIGRHVFPKRGEEVIVNSLEPIVIPGNSFFNPMGIEIRDENDELYDLQIPYIIEWSFTPFTSEVSTPPPGSLSCAT